VSAGRDRIYSFRALSCIRTMAIDCPCPVGRKMGIARPESAAKGWEPTTETGRPRSDLVKLRHSIYANVNY
jgi:hypothetical protein